MPATRARKPSPMQEESARNMRKKMNGMINRSVSRTKTFIVNARYWAFDVVTGNR